MPRVDVEALFDWLCLPRESIPPEEQTHDDEFKRKNDTYVSPLGLERLNMQLAAEYELYATLEALADNGRRR